MKNSITNEQIDALKNLILNFNNIDLEIKKIYLALIDAGKNFTKPVFFVAGESSDLSVNLYKIREENNLASILKIMGTNFSFNYLNNKIILSDTKNISGASEIKIDSSEFYEEKIRKIIAIAMGTTREKIDLKLNLRNEIHADEIDRTCMTKMLQKEFAINITDNETSEWETGEDIRVCVSKKKL